MKFKNTAVLLVALSLSAIACGKNKESSLSKAENEIKNLPQSPGVMLGKCEFPSDSLCSNLFYSGGEPLDLKLYIDEVQAECSDVGGIFSSGSGHCSRNDVVASCHYQITVLRSKISVEVLFQSSADLTLQRKNCAANKGTFSIK